MVARLRFHQPSVPCVALAAAAILGLSACGTPGGRADPVAFADCPSTLASALSGFDPELAAKVDLACGPLDVPLDYDEPDGERITLQVIRARHKDQVDRLGSLIFHPGGPGEPGVEYTPYLLTWLPEAVLKRFDLVSLDPRGTGGSAPINCPSQPDDPERTTPDVLTPEGFAAAADAERRISRACLDALGPRAPFFTTQTAARDVDRLRAAIGDPELTFFGASYGAKLGAEYARQFPDRVRAAVLDAPSEPADTLFAGIVSQTKGMEHTFSVYAEGCATRPSCQLGDVHTFVTRLLEAADADPIPTADGYDDRRADGTDILAALRAALLAEERWPELDSVLMETAHGDSGGIFGLVDGVYGRPVPDSAPADPMDANYVINCNDSALGPTDVRVRTQARTMARDFPIFGAGTAQYLFACKTWQSERSVLQPPVAATRNRVLVVGTVHDAATPYNGAVALTRILGNATLLTWEGNSHTALAFSACIGDIAADYLINLTVPPDGTRCPP